MVGMGTPMAGASYGVMSNTLKPLTNAQTVRGRPTQKDDNERAFRKGSFCRRTRSEYLNCCNQVLATSKEISAYKICANCEMYLMDYHVYQFLFVLH